MFLFPQYRLINALMAVLLVAELCLCPSARAELVLPKPGTMVALSPSVQPPVLKGIKVFAKEPFKFDFILDQGQPGDIVSLGAINAPIESVSPSTLPSEQLLQSKATQGNPASRKAITQPNKEEINRLIKYFLASLTTPEGDLWVNLSPYEKDRIVPTEFGQTAMGRDLLTEDYLLKQITASLMHPDGEVGKKFWKKIYTEAAKRYGSTQVPVNTFNKVWIVPNKAEIYEGPMANGQATAYVTQATLKVMLEEDYLSQERNTVSSPSAVIGDPELSKQIIKQIIIPELEKEINQGSNFAQLRQIYHSLILATWYKKKIKQTIIAKQYVDQRKVVSLRGGEADAAIFQGIKKIASPSVRNDTEYIYQQYLKSFKQGAYNLIKEEPDPITGQAIPRKYFAGGAKMGIKYLAQTTQQPTKLDNAQLVKVNFQRDKAMSVNSDKKIGKQTSTFTRQRRHVPLRVLLADIIPQLSSQPKWKNVVDIGLGVTSSGIVGPTFEESLEMYRNLRERKALDPQAKFYATEIDSMLVRAAKEKWQNDQDVVIQEGGFEQLAEIVNTNGKINLVTALTLQQHYFAEWQEIVNKYITPNLAEGGIFIENNVDGYFVYRKKGNDLVFYGALWVVDSQKDLAGVRTDTPRSINEIAGALLERGLISESLINYLSSFIGLDLNSQSYYVLDKNPLFRFGFVRPLWLSVDKAMSTNQDLFQYAVPDLPADNWSNNPEAGKNYRRVRELINNRLAQLTTSEVKDGYTTRGDAQGRPVVEISPLGVKRYFDEKGNWVLEFDPSGVLTAQMFWDEQGVLKGLRYRNMLGNWIRIIEEIDSTDVDKKNIQVLAILEQGNRLVYTFKTETLGVSFINEGKIPGGGPNINLVSEDARKIAGHGIMILNIMASFGRLKGHLLEYVGFSGNDGDFQVLLDAIGKQRPDTQYNPKPNDLLVIQPDDLIVLINPETGKILRIGYKGTQYFNSSDYVATYDAKKYVFQVISSENGAQSVQIFNPETNLPDAVIEIQTGRQLPDVDGNSNNAQIVHADMAMSSKEIQEQDSRGLGRDRAMNSDSELNYNWFLRNSDIDLNTDLMFSNYKPYGLDLGKIFLRIQAQIGLRPYTRVQRAFFKALVSEEIARQLLNNDRIVINSDDFSLREMIDRVLNRILPLTLTTRNFQLRQQRQQRIRLSVASFTYDGLPPKLEMLQGVIESVEGDDVNFKSIRFKTNDGRILRFVENLEYRDAQTAGRIISFEDIVDYKSFIKSPNQAPVTDGAMIGRWQQQAFDGIVFNFGFERDPTMQERRENRAVDSLDIILETALAPAESYINGRVTYDIFVQPRSKEKPADQYFTYQGNVDLVFEDGKLVNWDEPVIRLAGEKKYPWLENFLIEKLRGLKQASFIARTSGINQSQILLQSGVPLRTIVADPRRIKSIFLPQRVVDSGKIIFKDAVDWYEQATSFETLDRKFQLKKKLAQLMQSKQQKADKRIRILDWGCGIAFGMGEFGEWLSQQGIKDVQLDGFADEYQPYWNQVKDIHEIMLGTADDLFKLAGDEKYNIIYSHWGLRHHLRVLGENGGKIAVQGYLRKLFNQLTDDGELIVESEMAQDKDFQEWVNSDDFELSMTESISKDNDDNYSQIKKKKPIPIAPTVDVDDQDENPWQKFYSHNMGLKYEVWEGFMPWIKSVISEGSHSAEPFSVLIVGGGSMREANDLRKQFPNIQHIPIAVVDPAFDQRAPSTGIVQIQAHVEDFILPADFSKPKLIIAVRSLEYTHMNETLAHLHSISDKEATMITIMNHPQSRPVKEIRMEIAYWKAYLDTLTYGIHYLEGSIDEQTYYQEMMSRLQLIYSATSKDAIFLPKFKEEMVKIHNHHVERNELVFKECVTAKGNEDQRRELREKLEQRFTRNKKTYEDLAKQYGVLVDIERTYDILNPSTADVQRFLATWGLMPWAYYAQNVVEDLFRQAGFTQLLQSITVTPDVGDESKYMVFQFDKAQASTGGIDLNKVDQQLQVAGNNDFQFEDKAMAAIRINSLTPVIRSIEPLTSLATFFAVAPGG